MKNATGNLAWSDRPNLKIKEYILPADREWRGISDWSERCDQASSGEIPSRLSYEIVYYSGDGIWCIGGNSESKEEAIAIALAQNPAPWDGGLEPGYVLTSTGEKILAEDWDDVEGAM